MLKDYSVVTKYYHYDDKKYDRIPEEKLNELFKEYIKGDKKDKKLKDKLVNVNIRLVIYFLNKHFYEYIGTERYDDIFQAGCLGLIQAIDNYNPDNGNTFATYAVYKIECNIKFEFHRFNYPAFTLNKRDASLVNRLNKLETLGYTKEEIINTMKITENIYNKLKKVQITVSESVSKDSIVNFGNNNKDDKKDVESIITNCDNKDYAYINLLRDEITKLLNTIFNDKNIFKNEEWLYIYKEKVLKERSNIDIGKELNLAHNTISWRFKKMNDKVKRKYGKQLKELLKN